MTKYVKDARRRMIILLGVFCCLTLNTSIAGAAVDAYVVYGGKNKPQKQRFLKTLPKEISVKSYNVDLLAVADYSGKQKVLTKLDKASVIVMLLDHPMTILEGSTVRGDLIIVESSMDTVRSEALTVYVLKKGSNSSPLGGQGKVLEVNDLEPLRKMENLESVDVVLVDEQGVDVFQAASLVVRTVLRH